MYIGEWSEKEIIEDMDNQIDSITDENGFICGETDPDLKINKGSNVFYLKHYRRLSVIE
jgi:hypothetical protein